LLTDFQLQETFKNVPPDKLYLETDTKPISITTVYQKAAEIKNLPVDVLRESISNNFARDFKS
jgi:TatD DNase family protein